MQQSVEDDALDSPMDTASLSAPAGTEDSLGQPSPAEKQTDEVEKPTDGPRIAEDLVVEQTHHLVVPTYAAWFDYHRYVLKGLEFTVAVTTMPG